MKKRLFIGALVLVLLFTLLQNFGSVVSAVHAVESTQVNEDPMPIEVTQVSTDGGQLKEKSDYTLPYPGILPDHPLYFLKDFRDKIIEMLIVDPERKAEFYLLQSDKYLNAAVSLLEKNQTEKAKAILMRSVEKMTMAVGELATMKANGRQVAAGSVDRMTKATEKHFEVLEEMNSKLDTAESVSSLQKAEEEVMKLK